VIDQSLRVGDEYDVHGARGRDAAHDAAYIVTMRGLTSGRRLQRRAGIVHAPQVPRAAATYAADPSVSEAATGQER
jgi:hypothetical protein